MIVYVVQPFDEYQTRAVHHEAFLTREAAEAFVARMAALRAEEEAMPVTTPDDVWEAWHAQHEDEAYDAYGFSIIALDVHNA